MADVPYTIEKLPNSHYVTLKIHHQSRRLIELMGAMGLAERAVWEHKTITYKLSQQQAGLFKTLADAGFECSRKELLYHPNTQSFFTIAEALGAISSGQIVVANFLADLEGF
jgi:hypothetical protein